MGRPHCRPHVQLNDLVVTGAVTRAKVEKMRLAALLFGGFHSPPHPRGSASSPAAEQGLPLPTMSSGSGEVERPGVFPFSDEAGSRVRKEPCTRPPRHPKVRLLRSLTRRLPPHRSIRRVQEAQVDEGRCRFDSRRSSQRLDLREKHSHPPRHASEVRPSLEICGLGRSPPASRHPRRATPCSRYGRCLSYRCGR